MAMSAHQRREDSEMMIVTAFRCAAPPGDRARPPYDDQRAGRSGE